MSEPRARVRSLDGPSLGLLCALFVVSGLGAARAGWVRELRIVPVVAALAVLVGAALALSRFSWQRAAAFAGLYGAAVVVWQLGRTLDHDLAWRERLGVLGARLEMYLTALLYGDRNQDPLMFVFLIACLYWVIGAYASWSAFRSKRLWPAVIPAGIVLLVHAYYNTGRAPMDWFLGGYVFLAMVFVMAQHVMARRAAWDTMRTELPVRSGRTITQAGLVAAAVLVGLAWGGPAFARSETAADLWSDLSRPWPRIRERIGDLLGNLGSPALVARDMLSNTLGLGAGTEPPDLLIMRVRPEPTGERSVRFYWRARVFDTYRDREWSASPGASLAFDPAGDDLPIAEYARRQMVEAVVTPHLKAFQVLYVAGQPVWIDRPSLAAVTYMESGAVDVTVLSSIAPVMGDEVYRMRVLLAVPTESDLRAAGTDYPEWVRDRYLLVPETITARTRSLAEEIAAGAATPYDQVVAVTRWLREHIAYSRITQAPPANVEPIDWLLFDYRVGFCNYYASAEVILLRILGIPARLAVGFASGTFDATTGTYEVRGGDGHAWPEVFFPGFGWVEFEPTAALPSPPWGGIPEGEANEGDPLAGGFDVPDTLDQSQEPAVPPTEPPLGGGAGRGLAGVGGVLVVLGGLGLLIAGGLVWLWMDPYAKAVVFGSLSERLRRLGVEPPDAMRGIPRPPATATGRLYLRWTMWLARCGIPTTPAQTPFERAQALTARMPAAQNPAWALVTAYAAERFGDRPPDEAAVRDAWRAMRPRLRAAWANRLLRPRH